MPVCATAGPLRTSNTGLGSLPTLWSRGAFLRVLWIPLECRYNGIIEAVSVSGNFIVAFDGYESKEEVQPGSVRPRAEEEDEGGYKGDAMQPALKGLLSQSLLHVGHCSALRLWGFPLVGVAAVLLQVHSACA